MIYEKCPQGHRYDGHRTKPNGKVYQVCRTCQLDATRRARARKRGHPVDVLVPAGPTVARLRALCRMAWPARELASRTGVQIHHIYRLIGEWQDTPCIHQSLAEKAEATYNELSMIHGPSTRTAAWAQRRKWPPPMDLDDDELDW
jgi:hypothetical protein